MRLHRVPSLMRFFYIQRIKGFEAPLEPLMDDEATEWITGQLKKTRLYLEFGAGGSTVLANKLGVRSITVESDPFYATAVRRALRDPEKARIVTPRMGFTSEWGMPIFFKEKKGPRYVRAPFDEIGQSFPDFIFVDGRYRVACVLESARQALRAQKTASVLVDDYEYRPRYHVLEQHLGKPDRIGRAALFVVGDRSIQKEAVQAFLGDPS